MQMCVPCVIVNFVCASERRGRRQHWSVREKAALENGTLDPGFLGARGVHGRRPDTRFGHRTPTGNGHVDGTRYSHKGRGLAKWRWLNRRSDMHCLVAMFLT
jgi:hypothetical protein